MTAKLRAYRKMRLTLFTGRAILYLDDVAYRLFREERRQLLLEETE